MNGLWQTTVTYGRRGFPPAVGSTYKQDYRMVFNNTTGNVTSLQDYLRSKSESFTYDTGLDRLLTVTGPQNLTMNYAANGNFSQKSDVGSVYTYGTTGKPYQLTEIETSTGLVSDVEQTVVYTSFEQPSSITESPYQALFTYNADGERAKMEVKQSGAIKTRWYAGSRYIKETAGGITKEFTWIGGDAYSAPCLAVTQSGATTYYYLLRDHLGTITHITDASGNVVNEYNFDAWGRRRNFTDWSYNVAAQTDILPDRGFTGHEYLPWFKLYNMNGRLYDPVVGRFLEPDPIIQNAFSTQNLNRYSYALNNPLKYVDPSGNRMLELLEGRGNNFWYRGDYYTRDDNGDWSGSMFGRAPDGGSPGGGASVFSINSKRMPGAYYYDETCNKYRDNNGNIVSFEEVLSNYVSPNSTVDHIYRHIASTLGFNTVTMADGFKLNGVLYEFGSPVPFNRIYPTNQVETDWQGVINATVLLAGGIAEMAIGGGSEYFSLGLSSSASVPLLIDGFARTIANSQRLFMYFNGNSKTANAYPTSLGGLAGKGVDMAFGVSVYSVGYGQAIGSWGNDLTSFVVTGGNGATFLQLQRSQTFDTGFNYIFNFFGYPYSMYSNKPSK